MATAATALNPTRNFPASCQPLARLLPPAPPPKNRWGMGTRTNTKAVNMGHQLCHRAQPRNCSNKPRPKAPASAPTLHAHDGARARGRVGSTAATAAPSAAADDGSMPRFNAGGPQRSYQLHISSQANVLDSHRVVEQPVGLVGSQVEVF